MKKYTILPILALALGFAACDDVDLGTGIPVVNPELPAAGPDLVTVTAAQLPAVIDLASYYDKGEQVVVANATAAEGWPEGYGFAAVAQLSSTEDFATSTEVPVEVLGSEFAFDPTTLSDAVRDFISKNPVETSVWVRYRVSAAKGNENIILGGPDKFYCPMQMNVVSFPPYTIDTEYYLAWSNTPDGWSVNNTAPFKHSSTNQYDDPEFKGVFHIAKDSYWMIISGTSLANSDFSNALGVVAGEEAKVEKGVVSGTLDPSAATQEAGKMLLGGSVEITFNMDTYAYSYKQAIENFWLAGNGVNGTSWNDGQFAMVMWTEDYVNYAGYAHLYGAAEPEFKFSPTNAWNGDFGCDGAIEFTTDPATGISTGSGTTGGSNIKVPAEGLYFISLNYGEGKISLTSIKTIGIIGDFNGWAASEAMTPSADMLTWTVTANMSAGNSWKFRMNDGWDINLGGSLDSLTGFGNPANLTCDADGTYEITLHLDTLPYTATMVKK